MKLDKVRRVLEQNFTGKATGAWGLCEYLTADGRKCAIGCFIPHGHQGQMLKDDVVELLTRYPGLKNYMPCNNLDLLADFQEFHDTELLDSRDVKEQRAALFNKYVQLCKEYGVQCV